MAGGRFTGDKALHGGAQVLDLLLVDLLLLLTLYIAHLVLLLLDLPLLLTLDLALLIVLASVAVFTFVFSKLWAFADKEQAA